MTEYPSMQNSSKAPRKHCIAFDKLDGSNFRAKWTDKRGFCLFGTKTQLIDSTTQFWGAMVITFRLTLEEKLHEMIKNRFKAEREVVVFCEYFGPRSFAGQHPDEGKLRKLVTFDVMTGHKERKFLLPQDFIQFASNKIETPEVVYVGNLTDGFIKDVRNGKYNVNEGVVCKGTQRAGNAAGGVWMAKIKTNDYIERLMRVYGKEWKRYGE